ncbi:MAG: ComEC/Rec2 family competence protein [Anaerolineaceae bacterium]|jgi:competence protein ComEC|nr:ComEC/Rec2 family competence protein [Anaerolineaceae bacterium]
MKKIPLFWISLAFLLGIPLAAFVSVPLQFWRTSFFACLGLLLVECLARRKCTRLSQQSLPVFLLLAVLAGGGYRYAAIQQKPFTPKELAYYNDQGRVNISGVVCSDPQHNEKSIRFTVCVEQMLKPNQRELTGKVLVVQRSGDWQYGDRVNLSGVPKTPGENEDFSYKDYLAQRGIYSLMEYPYVQWVASGQAGWVKSGLFSVRQQAYHLIQHFLPQPEAGLLAGILLGIETDIPYQLEKAFQETGTAHVVAISGFNMTILAGIFLKGFRKYLSIWWAGLLAILAMSLYTVLVGGAPAVVRAAVMSCLAMSTSLIGRGQSGIYTLTLTAAVMCLFNPLLLADAGFQLSVTATLGLVLYADRLMNWFRVLAEKVLPDTVVERITGPVSDYFLFTLAAQVMTLPVVLYHFKQLSLTTLIANPLILPVQPLVMILGGVAVIIGLVIPPLGQLLSYLVWVPLYYTNQVVTWLAGFSGGVVELGEMSLLTVAGLYLMIFFLAHKKKENRLFPQRKPLLLLGVMLAAIFLVWNAVLLQPDGKLHLWILDEPNQGVVFVQTPSGKRILINAGEYGNSLSSELGKQIPVLDRQIDLALVSDANTSTYQAYPKILERFKVDQFLWGEAMPATRTAADLQVILQQQQVPAGMFTAGQKVDCGDGVVLERFAQESTGVSLMLTYADFRLVWREEEARTNDRNQFLEGSVVLVRSGLEVDEMELTRQPQVMIHHEYQPGEVPGQLSTQNAGRIEIITDGKQMWMIGER